MSVRLAAALYRVALVVLPEPFRSQFGEEMRLDAAALFRERWDTGGSWSVLTASVGALVDLVGRAWLERRARWTRSSRDGTNQGNGRGGDE